MNLDRSQIGFSLCRTRLGDVRQQGLEKKGCEEWSRTCSNDTEAKVDPQVKKSYARGLDNFLSLFLFDDKPTAIALFISKARRRSSDVVSYLKDLVAKAIHTLHSVGSERDVERLAVSVGVSRLLFCSCHLR